MKQPNLDIQRELDRLKNDKPSKVAIPNTKKVCKIDWIRRNTLSKLTSVLNQEGKNPKQEDVVFCKAMALLVLNDYWKILFFYPILWRWYAYIRQYSEYQILPIIEEAKKKVPQIPYLLGMTYLLGLKDTHATMTREEVEHLHREQQ